MNDTINSTAAWGKGVVGIFVLGGLCSATFFSWITSVDSLQNLWYTKTDKFLLPTAQYWLLCGATFALGLLIAYRIIRFQAWLGTSAVTTIAREILFLLITSVSPVILFAVSGVMRSYLGLTWDILIAPVAFLAAFSVALCLLLPGFHFMIRVFALNLMAAAAAIGLITIFLRILNGFSNWYSPLQWITFEALLSLAAGFSFLWAFWATTPAER